MDDSGSYGKQWRQILAGYVVITQEYLCANIFSAYFKFAANDSPEERTGEIVFELNGETAVCHVVQKGVEDSSSTDK